MTEHTQFESVFASGVCGICLRAGEILRTLPAETARTLRILVPQMSSSILACNLCQHLAAKFIRFIRQCDLASQALTDSNSFLSQLQPYHNFAKSVSVVESHCFPSAEALKTEPLGDVDQVTDFVDENDYDGGLLDDDDMPLALIKEAHLKIDEPHFTDTTNDRPELLEPLKTVPYAASETDDNPPKSKKRKKKGTEAKKGNEKGKDKNDSDGRFSSRMVRETDRYLVVKLTKDEVRQEMADRATAEAYQRAPFKCAQCVKGFNFEDVLQNHMEKHSKDRGTLECDICFQFCPSAVSLRGHIKSHTTRYKCKVCETTRGARQHLLEHYARAHSGDATQHACPHCAFVTDKRTVLQRHARSHTAPHLPCERCGRAFKTVEALRVHTSRHESGRLPQCGQCGRRFVHQSALRRHQVAAHESSDYYCVECDVRFKSQENMKNHFEKAKVHRVPSSFKHPCPECDLILLTRATLSVHLCTAHGHARAHACSVCARAYGSRDALRGHVRRAHRPKAPRRHQCSVCGKAFEQKCSLSRHWRVHTGERAHACTQCPLRFAQAGTRDTHRALVHDRQPPRGSKRRRLSEAEYKADS